MNRLVQVLNKQQKVRKLLSQKSFKQCSNLSELKRFNEHFLSGSNSVYIEQLYEMWKEDKKSVLTEWDIYFQNVDEGLQPWDTFSLMNQQEQLNIQSTVDPIQQQIEFQIKLQQLVKSYQMHGHQIATLDPLQLDKKIQDLGFFEPVNKQKLDYQYYGFTEKDLDTVINCNYKFNIGLLSNGKQCTLRELIDNLKQLYCSDVGFEFLHIQSKEEREWLIQRIEDESYWQISKEHKEKIYERLGESYSFTQYLKNKFSTSKRFGVEGCDSSVSALGHLVDVAHQHQITNIVLGMPHRGRLETLAFIFKKDIAEILCEFQELKQQQELEWGNSGDVKYHLGTTHDKNYPDGSSIRLTILANPSHLEAVDPVVMGKVRAIQDYTTKNDSVLGVLIHGDAAFAGQGMVYETLQMQDLKGYQTQGTVHIITNNQIGFTTCPRQSRTGIYCTEIAKAISAPIFHVNADNPERVDKCIQIAMEFRQKFQKDVVIDIIGYRRHGHNELDQPMFTQPIMYTKVNATLPVFEKYSQKLLQESVITNQQKSLMLENFKNKYEQEYLKSKNVNFNKAEWQVLPWEQIKQSDNLTSISKSDFAFLGNIISSLPEQSLNFSVHPQIVKVYEQRAQMFQQQSGLDWATAEALAFGSLIKEGYKIRLSGEDVERGTFSHRHAVIIDQQNARKYTALNKLCSEKEDSNDKEIIICNSHLSEQGVLGFEYGYSLSNPNNLVLWEAQFGDFFNGAQVIFDNFISSAESKWNQSSNITLLLPHGLDGLGPEHSSARMMRFLQMSNDDMNNYDNFENKDKQLISSNFQLVNCTTSANYFHVLRRQLKRSFRKPLIVFSPKKLLRLKQATSNIDDFSEGSQFQEVIDDTFCVKNNVDKIILCQGQIYYDIINKREELNDVNTAIIRLEQLAPFPYLQLGLVLQNYQKDVQIIFVQEEHQNDGPWWFVRPRINKILQQLEFYQKNIQYVGRKPQGATATGSNKVHNIELQDILKRAFIKN